MPTFAWEAINAEGRILTGTLNADLLQDVERVLAKDGLSPINIVATSVGEATTEGHSARPQAGLLQRLTGVSLEDRILFCRQTATMLGAGVAILQALKIMARQTANPILRNIVSRVAEDIEGGANLSDAFGQFPREFDQLFQNILKVGEESGTLDVSFEYLARVFENEKEVREKIKAATRYPKIVVVGICTAVAFLMAFVMPKFIDMFSKSNIELPLPTRILIAASNLFSEHFILLGLTIAVVAAGYRQALKVKGFVRGRDRFLLRIPVLGPLSVKIYMSRFCRVFAVLAKSGVDIIKTLRLSASALDNLVLVETIDTVTADVEKGIDLYSAISRHELFPSMVVQMIAIGEESGSLDTMMDRVSDYYEMETDYAIKGLSTLIEPILLLVMGAIVGLLALAIYMPMWNMMNVMR